MTNKEKCAVLEDSEVTTWSKNQYHQMAKKPTQVYLVDLAAAVKDCAAVAQSQVAMPRQLTILENHSCKSGDIGI